MELSCKTLILLFLLFVFMALCVSKSNKHKDTPNKKKINILDKWIINNPNKVNLLTSSN